MLRFINLDRVSWLSSAALRGGWTVGRERLPGGVTAEKRDEKKRFGAPEGRKPLWKCSVSEEGIRDRICETEH